MCVRSTRMPCVAWSRPRWAGKHCFYVTCVLGPLLRPHNVQNDRTLGSIARHVQDKQNIAGYDRHWPTASLQSAQSAASTRHTVRGGQLSRPSARPQCAPAMPHAYHTFGFDVDQRLTACCRLRSPGSCLFAFLRRLPTEAWQHPRVGAWCMKVRATMMVCDPARPVPIMYEHDRAAAAFRSMT